MKWVVLFLPLIASALAQPAETPSPTPEPTPPIDRKVEFKVSIVGNRHEFHIGEIIPLKLEFSSRVKKRYQINEATYDRSGRMDYEHFVVTPADGAVDPLDAYFNSGRVFMGGGLTGFSFLRPKPWSIELYLNAWVRFTKPGNYKLSVTSSRVEASDSSQAYGTAGVTARSNELNLKILPRDPAWEKQTLDKAVTMLTRPDADQSVYEGDGSPTINALETLRFLETADATRELVNQLRSDKNNDNRNFICYMGLIASPYREIALQALEQALAAPDRPIDDTLIDALTEVKNNYDKNEKVREENERKITENLVQIIPKKRGDAARLSLYTILNRAWVTGTQVLSKETNEKLVTELISMFDQLPTEKQVWLLNVRWEEIKSPKLIPPLKRFIEKDLSKVSAEEYRDASWRTSWALRRWYELDPVGARPAIIREITRPKPLFSANTLGILPEKTLPEVDQALANNFCSPDRRSPELPSLIARYATGAILPQILKQVDHDTNSECGAGNGILAYILRVDPAAAKPRIEKTVAACRNRSRCLCNTFTEIAEIHNDPVLEEIAVSALDDPDAATAAEAATMLGKFGSAAAEAPLWKRYEKWCNRWAGHESEINISDTELDLADKRLNERWLGQSLCDALATGKAWLPDETKLRRIAALTKVPSVKETAEKYLAESKRQPLSFSISCSPSFDAHLGQYSFRSLDGLKQKLTEFPAGTKFVLWWPSVEQKDQSCIDDIRGFLKDHGISLENEKRPAGD